MHVSTDTGCIYNTLMGAIYISTMSCHSDQLRTGIEFLRVSTVYTLGPYMRHTYYHRYRSRCTCNSLVVLETSWYISSSDLYIRCVCTNMDVQYVALCTIPGLYAGGVWEVQKEQNRKKTERSTIFNNKLQKILLQTLDFDFKPKFGKKRLRIWRENGLLLNPIH